MGCASSSNKCCYRIHCFACVQLPAFSDDEDSEDVHHVVSLTSTSYGLLNTGTPPGGSFFNIYRHPSQYHHIPPSVDDNTEGVFVLEKEMETINMWELMEGLEDGSCKVIFPNEKLTLSSEASNSVYVLRDAANQCSLDQGTPVWKKYHVYTQADLGTQERVLMIDPSSPSLVDSPKNISSACPQIDLDDSTSISSASDPMEGLRVLLSPLNSPSCYNARCIPRTGFHTSSLSFDGITEHLTKGFHQICLRTPSRSPDLKKKKKKKRSDSRPSSLSSPDVMKRRCTSRKPSFDSMDVGKRRSTNTWSGLGRVDVRKRSDSLDVIIKNGRQPSSDDQGALFDNTDVVKRKSTSTWSSLHHVGVMKRSNKPDAMIKESRQSNSDDQGALFDPSLLATFEQALDAAMASGNDNDWFQPSNDLSATNSSSSSSLTTSVSTDTVSDLHSLRGTASSSAPIIMLHEQQDNSINLLSYELKCPPRGENRVVLYFTSLRGIRRTYEDCCVVRVILRGMGVCVDERDVWMHSKFKEELIDLLGIEKMGGALHVPQLFILGRYIGGVDKVKNLHEEGILVKLVDGVASSHTPWGVCDGCGDARFIPCTYCCGSCKLLDYHGNLTRCSSCNENGLIMCPTCTI